MGKVGEPARISILDATVKRVIDADDGEQSGIPVIESESLGSRLDIEVQWADGAVGVTPTASPTFTRTPAPTPTPTTTAAPLPLERPGGAGAGAARRPSFIAVDAIGVPLRQTPGASWNGYLYGFPDGSIQPNGLLTRGQLAAMVYRLVGNQGEYGDRAIAFSDLKAKAYYFDAVTFLASHGVINGYKDGTFRGGASITRAEACQIVCFFIEGRPSKGVGVDLSDLGKHWAAPRVRMLVEQGCIRGYPDGTFRPNGNITRAEAVAVINRAIGVDAAQVSDKHANPFSDIKERHWAYKDILVAAAKAAWR
jgi:hypothetical protein